ncbi:MAG: signal peptidase I [Clostridiales bacterium]|nr:signal peptidase I [Clostridiales bacterium]
MKQRNKKQQRYAPESAGMPDSAAIAAVVDELEAEDDEEPVKKKSPARRAISMILNVIMVVAIALAVFCTYVSFVSSSGNGVPNLFGVEFFSIQTDSMYPTLKSGDLIVGHTIKDTSSLEVGDIITYWTVIDGERVLNTHRINQIYDGGGYLIFETKGDNNSDVDSLTVHESEVVGQYVSRIGGVGKVFDYLQTSTGFLIVIVIPVAAFFVYQLIQFFRVLFEYQNVKNRLKYEQERGNTEEVLEQRKRTIEEEQQKQRAAIEAEVREKILREMLAEQAKVIAADGKAEAEPETKPETEAVAAAEPEAVAEAEPETESEAVAEAEKPEPAAETEES